MERQVDTPALRLGQVALLAAMASSDEELDLPRFRRAGFQVVVGRSGSMEVEKIIAAVETAARRTALVGSTYRDEHAVYHAAVEALEGVCRGNLSIGGMLRTVGLRFAVVKGPRLAEQETHDGEWIAVALYGTIGAPVRGWEHEVVGLGINHV